VLSAPRLVPCCSDWPGQLASACTTPPGPPGGGAHVKIEDRYSHIVRLAEEGVLAQGSPAPYGIAIAAGALWAVPLTLLA
jgi:hypothetical protein